MSWRLSGRVSNWVATKQPSTIDLPEFRAVNSDPHGLLRYSSRHYSIYNSITGSSSYRTPRETYCWLLTSPSPVPPLRVYSHSFVRQCHVSPELSIPRSSIFQGSSKTQRFIHYPVAFDAQQRTNEQASKRTPKVQRIHLSNLKNKNVQHPHLNPLPKSLQRNILLHTEVLPNTNHNTCILRDQILSWRISCNVLMIPDIAVPPPTCS